MTKFTDNLWSDLVREHGSTLAQAERPERGRARVLRRPRVLAGSSLGLAGVGAALVLALGGSTAAPAFAVTASQRRLSAGALNYNADQNLPQANAKLASMGIDEAVTIHMATGAASTNGAVTCSQGQAASTPVKVLVGDGGTESIAAGASAGNTAEGSFHLDHCIVSSDSGTGNSGNTGS